jgi:hypothetical protein
VEPTIIPEGVADSVYLEPDNQASIPPDMDIYGYAGDGRDIKPGTTAKDLLGGLYDKMKGLLSGKKVKEGISPDPKMFIQLSPAEIAARKMEKTILDQLEETSAHNELRLAVLEAVTLGTGIMKGPFTTESVTHKWEKDPDTGANIYNPIKKLLPESKFVSFWNFYPDPNAKKLKDCSYCIERHLLAPHEFKALLFFVLKGRVYGKKNTGNVN